MPAIVTVLAVVTFLLLKVAEVSAKLTTSPAMTPLLPSALTAAGTNRGQVQNAATRPAGVTASAASALTDSAVSLSFRLVRSISPSSRAALLRCAGDTATALEHHGQEANT